MKQVSIILPTYCRAHCIGRAVESVLCQGGVSSHVGGYFQARCQMIALHRTALLQYGLFNQVAEKRCLWRKE